MTYSEALRADLASLETKMTAKLDTIAAKIKTAKNLWDLHISLVEFEQTGNTDEDGIDHTGDRYRDFDAESELAARGVDICELPTFGGRNCTSEGTWSWDEDHVLAGEGPFKDWEIRERTTA